MPKFLKSRPLIPEITDRNKLENFEEITLAPYAFRSRGAHRTRRYQEPEHAYRTAFQRDRDRIIHSRAFRRLKHKRQVFLTSVGDHYRTRITHTLEVSQLSRTMGRALGLNEDLTEAIALGHDIGHTPFGHLGEVILNEIMTGKKPLDGQNAIQSAGGFKHNYQSLRIVDFLEKKYQFNGLNLTAPVREGILKHTRLRRKKLDYPDFVLDGLFYQQDMSSHLEGQVVAICDEIAQRTHDLEDGIRAGLVAIKRLQELRVVKIVESNLGIKSLADENEEYYIGRLISGLINFFVDDVIQNSLQNIKGFLLRNEKMSGFDQQLVCFSPRVDPLQNELNKFIYKEIIDHSKAQWSDELAEKLLYRLFEVYYHTPSLIPQYAFRHDDVAGQADAKFLRLICDHISGMTDSFAAREAWRLSNLGKFDATGLNLELVLGAPLKHDEN
ncbi:MAG: dGTP triphosphohydrolase [bacterium]